MSLVSRNFDQLIDFTRTSAATYVDSTGKIVTTPASRNLLTYTQEFDNAAWTKTNITTTANAISAPDGTTTADKIEATTTAATNFFTTSTAITVTGTSATYSVYVKQGNGETKANSFLLRNLTTATNLVGIIFNYSTGTFTYSVGSTGVSAVDVGNGWWRLQITATTGITSGDAMRVYAGFTSGAATAGDFLYAWGAQLETGSTATTYTRNNGGVYPPRFDYDPVTLAPKGLLIEEQRTNLLTYSEQFDNAAWTKTNITVTANTTVAPDGTNAGDTITGVTAGASNFLARTITASATQYTYSIWVMAGTANTCALLIRDITSATNLAATAQIISGPGSISGTSIITVSGLSTTQWTRIAITLNAAATAGNTLQAYFYPETSVSASTTAKSNIVWGAQLEAGAFATSYIPTVASQVTRTADQAAINAPNFASWYNQSEGTFLAEFTTGGLGAINSVVASSDGGATNEIYAYANTTSVLQRVATANVQQVSSTAGASAANTTYKLAMAYKLNDFAVSLGGAAAVTDTSGTVPTVDRLTIGARGALSSPLNGHIRSIRYYPTRLSNAQLQALTA